jgi:hypothetical protein
MCDGDLQAKTASGIQCSYLVEIVDRRQKAIVCRTAGGITQRLRALAQRYVVLASQLCFPATT